MKFFATPGITKLSGVTKSFRRGSALLLALVLTMALFIMGLVFVSTTQTEKETVSRVDELQTLDTAVDTVIGRINTVLVDDLIYKDPILGDEMLDGTGDSQGINEKNEYYDYPGPDDPWLASLEPMLLSDNGTPTNDTDDWYAWRHISDIYDNNFGINPSALYFDPDDKSNTSQWDSTVSLAFWVRSTFGIPPQSVSTVARIVSDKDSTECIKDNADTSTEPDIWLWGARADADGDGVADSRWVKVPNLTGPRGQNVYTAVRIIDNGGMININTAFRDPSGLTTTPGEWDGSRLSHVNLEGIMASTESGTLGELQGWRYGTITTTRPDLDDYANDEQYDDNVSQRIMNPLRIPGPPVEVYMPFDITDELELRNRVFMASPVTSSCETIWPVTFNPGPGNVGIELPYTIGDSLKNWYYKLKPDIDQPDWQTGDFIIHYYNRRFFSTTYNFDRVIVPKMVDDAPAWTALTMPSDLKVQWQNWNHWDEVQSDKWLYQPVCVNDIAAKPTPENLKLLAAAIWLALPDSPTNSPAEGFQYSPPGYNPVWTMTRDELACQLAVNLVDYIDNDPDSTSMAITVGAMNYTYYGFEPENKVYISKIAKGAYKDHLNAHGGGIDKIYNCYAVELYNPSSNDIDIEDWKFDINGTPIDISTAAITVVPATATLVFTGSDNAAAADPDTIFGLVGAGIDLASFIFNLNDKIALLDKADGCPVDAIDTGTPVLTPPDDDSMANYLERGDWILNERMPVWDTTTSWVLPGNLGSFAPVASAPDKNISKIAIGNRDDDELPNVGEAFLVFGIGARREGNASPYNYRTLPEWLNSFSDRPNDDMKTIDAGRINPVHIDFVNISRYLTVKNFNPFSDPDIDNDGNGKIGYASRDGIDNDGQNGIDDPGEVALDDNYELMVAGRININTAPWFVIAQLPWVVDPSLPLKVGGKDNEDRCKLARAIVAYRDLARVPNKEIDYSRQNSHLNWNAWTALDAANQYKSRKFAMGLEHTDDDISREDPGFANITELINVTHSLKTVGLGSITYDEYYDIRRYGRDEDPAGSGTPKNNNESVPHDPDPSPFFDEDDAANDLEERDVIFQRISNLITVRSDVFTAYIMVRVGELGPQKRVIAIFDRSNVYNSGDTPKLVALHPVPDPR
jgi:hypothetical protein